jgi:hypothetical protein
VGGRGGKERLPDVYDIQLLYSNVCNLFKQLKSVDGVSNKLTI